MRNFFQKIMASFRTRSFRVGGYSVTASCMVLAIAVAANLFVNALPSSLTQFDITAGQLFSISEQTENIVSGLESQVTIYWIVQDGAEDTTIQTLLNRYQDLSDAITVKKIDPDVYPTFLTQYALTAVYNNSLVVESGSRYRYVGNDEIYIYDYSSYYYTGSYDISFDGESVLTSAIDYVINEDLPKIYSLTGHGESSLSTTFSTAVEKENMEIEDLSLLTVEYIPEDADAVMIYAPQSDISAEEKEKLENYLFNGGNLILITDPPTGDALINLEALMAYYGVSAAEGIVVEGNQNYYAWGTPYCLLPQRQTHSITSPLISGGYYVLLPIAQGLCVSSELSGSVTVTELLTTSEDAFSKIASYNLSTYEKEEDDISGPFSLAVAINDTLDDGIETNIIWISSAAILDDQVNSQVSGGNQDFFLNTLSYLCEPESSSISIHAKSLSAEYLTMDDATASVWSIFVIGIIPLVYMGIGIVICYRRKHR